MSDTFWDIGGIGIIVLVCSAATNLFMVYMTPDAITASVLAALAGVQIMTIGWILK